MRQVFIVPHILYGGEAVELFNYGHFIERQIDDLPQTPIDPTGRDSRLATRLFPAEVARHSALFSFVAMPRQLQRDLVLEQTYQAFDRAVEWAGLDGTLAIGLGHGRVRPSGNLYVAMAPREFLPAHRIHFERAEAVLQGEAEEQSLDANARHVLRVARRVRAGSIARIDFLSCQVGVGRRGRRFLQAAARAFGTRVRGVRGDFKIFIGTTREGEEAVRASAFVVPSERSSCSAPRRRRPRAPYCVDYDRSIPTDPRLWTTADP